MLARGVFGTPEPVSSKVSRAAEKAVDRDWVAGRDPRCAPPREHRKGRALGNPSCRDRQHFGAVRRANAGIPAIRGHVRGPSEAEAFYPFSKGATDDIGIAAAPRC